MSTLQHETNKENLKTHTTNGHAYYQVIVLQGPHAQRNEARTAVGHENVRTCKRRKKTCRKKQEKQYITQWKKRKTHDQARMLVPKIMYTKLWSNRYKPLTTKKTRNSRKSTSNEAVLKITRKVKTTWENSKPVCSIFYQTKTKKETGTQLNNVNVARPDTLFWDRYFWTLFRYDSKACRFFLGIFTLFCKINTRKRMLIKIIIFFQLKKVNNLTLLIKKLIKKFSNCLDIWTDNDAV